MNISNRWIATYLLITSCFSVTSTDAQSQTPDDIRATVQGICPVSGLELGAHGPPIKAKIGDEILFLCCEGCENGRVKQEHWAKIHQNLAKGQAKCLVMNNPLPKKPKWVIVKGQLIYVCCPPCIEEIKASPDKYLDQLATRYAAYVETVAAAK